MRSSPVCGPEINIKLPRLVTTSKLYHFCFHGDTKGVKTLLTEGAASPWDVNERGSSALYVSHSIRTLASFSLLLWHLILVIVKPAHLLNENQFAAISGDVGLCRFLIEQGADPLLENRYHTYAERNLLDLFSTHVIF